MISFHIFPSCTILVYSICHTGFLLHLTRYHHCSNLGEFGWCTQVQTGSLGFYFPCCSILQRNFPNLGMEILALHSAKSFWGLFFLILFLYSTLLFKNYLKQTQGFLPFPFICRWHVIVETYRKKKLNILIITCQSMEKNTN